MERILTIVILTYNRRERLLKQLHSIYNQKESSEVLIEVVDNHSNYDVYSAIQEEFGASTIQNLHVSVNPVNYGMHGNLALLFFHCKTKWLWSLSDDDETKIDSISTILKDIETYPDTAVFKYAMNTAKNAKEDVELSSLPQLIDYYLDHHLGSGHLIFLSNNVFNMEYAMKCYGATLAHCYSCISQILPIFHILDEKAGIVRLRKKVLVNFKLPEPGTGYPYLYTAVEISSTNMFKYNLSNKYFYKLGFLVTNGFSHYRLASSALAFEDRARGRFLYLQVYSRAYKYSGHFIDKLYRLLFGICYVLHLQLPEESARKFRDSVRKVFPNFR